MVRVRFGVKVRVRERVRLLVQRQNETSQRRQKTNGHDPRVILKKKKDIPFGGLIFKKNNKTKMADPNDR